MTDEQLVAFMDSAQERLTDEARARFSETVEAVRTGWIFAHDQKQYSRWRADVARKSGRRPEGSTTIEQLARDFPDHVGLPN